MGYIDRPFIAAVRVARRWYSAPPTRSRITGRAGIEVVNSLRKDATNQQGYWAYWSPPVTVLISLVPDPSGIAATTDAAGIL